jgi:dihydroorotase
LTTDIITTDHAPHTLEEKENPIFNLCQAPDGSALSQLHVEFYKQELISLEK